MESGSFGAAECPVPGVIVFPVEQRCSRYLCAAYSLSEAIGM
jgi:hypothetical protein